MCVSPRIIDNPNYGSTNALHLLIHDCHSSKIEVPCGDCPQCRSRKQTDLLQRVQMESLNSYVFFFTLTYNKNVPTYSLPNGKVLMRAEYKHIVDMFKRIRKTQYFGERKFKYLVTSEFSPKRARPHYHGLLFLKKLPSDSRLEYVNLEGLVKQTLLHEWRVNIATRIAKKDSKKYKMGDIIPDTRNPKYIPLCDYKVSYRNGKPRSTFDCHYVTPNSVDGSNDVSFYVMKYLFKSGTGEKFVQACCYNCGVSQNAAKDIYKTHFKSRNRKSLNFGSIYTDDSYSDFLSTKSRGSLVVNRDIQSKIDSFCSLSIANDTGLSFYDIYTGKRMPLAKYYERLVDESLLVEFRVRLRQQIESGEIQDKCLKLDKAMQKYRKQSAKCFVTDLFDDDQLLVYESLPDDLPDASPYVLDSDLPIPSDDQISPDPLDWEDLPEPLTSKEKIIIIKQLSLKLS